MALILNIDTATEKAGVALSDEGKTILKREHFAQQEHATWLHISISEMMKESGYELKDLKAVAVTQGPGSYTGLRVGMAAAKGFCYALRIPLIAENTLKVMAFAAREQVSEGSLLCPMIDARRMEVFTALYRSDIVEVLAPTAMVIDENAFSAYLAKEQVSFFGGGSDKCKPIIVSANAHFVSAPHDAGHLGILSFLRYLHQEFTDLAYSEPAYTKEFYTHTRK